MEWIPLESLKQLDEIEQLSKSKTIILFKHSTRCPISTVAKLRLQQEWNIDIKDFLFYFLDLIQFRSISNEIESRFQVRHESPQIIVLQKGEVIYDNSHLDISIADLESVLVYHA